MNSLAALRRWASLLHGRIERLRRTENITNVNLALYRLKRLLDVCVQLQGMCDEEASNLELDFPSISQTYFRYWKEDYIDRAVRVLIFEAKEALKNSKEYSYGPFKERLLTALDNRGIVDIQRISSREIKIRYRMNPICGNVADYLDAANQARESNRHRNQHGSHKTRGVALINPNTPPLEGEDLASLMWREKIFGVFEGKKITRRVYDKIEKKYKEVDITALYKGVYESIIKERFLRMKTPAPFWFFLENGNINFSKGGSGKAYPVQQPTRFVTKAINHASESISEHHRDQVDRIYDENVNEYKDLQAINSFLLEIMKAIEELLQELERGLVGYKERLTKEILKRGMKDLEKAAYRRGARPTAYDKALLEKRAEEAALRLIAGEVEGRVSLGSYYEVRIRPRTRRIELKVAATIPQVFRPIEEKTLQDLVKMANKIHQDFLDVRRILGR